MNNIVSEITDKIVSEISDKIVSTDTVQEFSNQNSTVENTKSVNSYIRDFINDGKNKEDILTELKIIFPDKEPNKLKAQIYTAFSKYKKD